MFYALKGRVTAAGNTSKKQEIVSGFLRLYAGKESVLPRDSNTTNNTEFNQIVSESELGSVVGELLAREPLEQDGRFSATVDDRQNAYEGEWLQLVFELSYFQPMIAPARGYRPVFVMLRNFQPAWEIKGLQSNAEIEISLPAHLIPEIMAAFDIWSVVISMDSSDIIGANQHAVVMELRGKPCLEVTLTKNEKGQCRVREAELLPAKKQSDIKIGTEKWLKEVSFRFSQPKVCIDNNIKIQTAKLRADQRQILFHLSVEKS